MKILSLLQPIFILGLFFGGVCFGFAFAEELEPLFKALGFATDTWGFYSDNLSTAGMLANLIEQVNSMLESK